jgi:hypothetical protein
MYTYLYTACGYTRYSYYPMLWCSKNAPAWCSTDWTHLQLQNKNGDNLAASHEVTDPRMRDSCVLIGHSHLCLWYRDDGPSHPSTQLTRTRTPERTACTFFGCWTFCSLPPHFDCNSPWYVSPPPLPPCHSSLTFSVENAHCAYNN